MINKILKINGTMLEENQLIEHLQKIASGHNLTHKSKKETYPLPNLIESYEIIEKVYKYLTENVKIGIQIHPAGEWLLDNFYTIEETVKMIEKELTLKKYMNFVGLANGQYEGFARIYVLASEIIAYSDNKVEKRQIEEYLKSYQTKKTLSMDEIWNIGIFLNIAIIENICEVCEKIYNSQIQKYKVENIIERLVENKPKQNLIYTNSYKNTEKEITEDLRYPFVEYMSYTLKKYGKKAIGYLNALEESVEIAGSTVSEIIKKEHFDIAVRKVLIGNGITSIKKISRINFLEIFEKINGVEELLKKDPSGVYEKMDIKTKAYYRAKIKEIARKTKISEIYITKKLIELAKKELYVGNIENKKYLTNKKSHIGYYLIDKGIDKLYNELNVKKRKSLSSSQKVKLYILNIIIFSIIVSFLIATSINKVIPNNYIYLISFILFLLPVSEIVVQIIQTILGKIIKPKIIPKLDFEKGLSKENTTMVVIPTILTSREKVKELIKKLEVYYIANKSSNLYLTLLRRLQGK